MEFYPNGAVKVKGNYTDGFKNGTFSFYNEERKENSRREYM